MSTPKVSIIIPLYYCKPSLYQIIQKSLNSAAELKGSKELIVVDDASPIEVPFTTTITNSGNFGFTKTVNVGLAAATGDILVVMNDDIVITQECFDRMKKISGLTIVSPADTASSPDDRFGACWAMTRRTYQHLGPLDEDYRNFFSDVEYYERARKHGVGIYKWRDIVLHHPESSTFNLINKDRLLEEDKERYYSR